MTREFVSLKRLEPGDKVAILSPSFAAPGRWPHVFELGLSRIRDAFSLAPIVYPSTANLNASIDDKIRDLQDAFCDPEIKGVIATIGGDHQVTYITRLAREVFQNNPKPFWGYSDNTQLINFLWLNGIPAYYGGCVFTEFAMQGQMDQFTVNYLKHSMFTGGEIELKPSEEYNEIGLDWSNPEHLHSRRLYEPNPGWEFSGSISTSGIAWGGAIEAVDEILRHNLPLPTLKQFENIVLYLETSEEIPPAPYVFRFIRALGERGILERIKGVLVGRAKAWEHGMEHKKEAREQYRRKQQEVILSTIRKYNSEIPVVQNMDFGHTAPQIPIPSGQKIRIDGSEQRIFATF